MCSCCAGNSQISIFRASGNNISGPLPKSLGALGSLMELVLADNLLTGTLPVIVPGENYATHLYILSVKVYVCEEDTVCIT